LADLEVGMSWGVDERKADVVAADDLALEADKLWMSWRVDERKADVAAVDHLTLEIDRL